MFHTHQIPPCLTFACPQARLPQTGLWYKLRKRKKQEYYPYLIPQSPKALFTPHHLSDMCYALEKHPTKSNKGAASSKTFPRSCGVGKEYSVPDTTKLNANDLI